MSARERLQDLVDRLPPAEEDTARRVLEALTGAPRAGAPVEEELRLPLPPNVSAGEARTLLAMRLFELGKVSREKAADLAGLPVRDFLDVLAIGGVPLLDYDAAELAAELEG